MYLRRNKIKYSVFLKTRKYLLLSIYCFVNLANNVVSFAGLLKLFVQYFRV